MDVGAHFISKGQVRISADVLTILIDISRDFPEALQANALIGLTAGHITSFHVLFHVIR